MQTQPTNNPDVLAALERVLAGRQSVAEEIEQARLRTQRENTARRVSTLAPPEHARAGEYVLVQLQADTKNPEYVPSLSDVLLTDPSTNEAIRIDLVAGLPHFVEARFLAAGWEGRECKKLADAGLLTLQAPARDGSWVVSDSVLYGKMLGRVAIGHEDGRLDTGKPRISVDEFERAIPIVAAGAPELAAALAKLVRGATVPLITFLPAGSYYGGVERQVGMK